MTAAEVVGLSTDRLQLVLRVDGETVEVPLELVHRAERIAARALSRVPDPTEPLTPRAIQQRIRCGETPEQIADLAGVPVAQVARFARPPLAEREHQAELARRSSFADSTVEALVTSYLGADEPEWDTWLVDDGQWELTAQAAGQTLRFAWDSLNRRVQPLDETARRALRAAPPAEDVLTSVLRPVGSGAAPVTTEQRTRTGRAEVPPWDDITRQVTGRDNS